MAFSIWEGIYESIKTSCTNSGMNRLLNCIALSRLDILVESSRVILPFCNASKRRATGPSQPCMYRCIVSSTSRPQCPCSTPCNNTASLKASIPLLKGSVHVQFPTIPPPPLHGVGTHFYAGAYTSRIRSRAVRGEYLSRLLAFR